MKREISLLEILVLLKKRWWIILLSGILVAAIAFGYSQYTYVPKYTTTVDVLVKTGSQASVNEAVSGATLAQKVFSTCMDLLSTEDFMEDISDTYKERYPKDWERMPYGAKWLKNAMKFTVDNENSTIFTVSVTTKNPDDSFKLGEIFEELAPDEIAKYEDSYSVEISDSARRVDTPSNSKNATRNTIMGLLVGVVLSFVIVFVIDISDVRIKRESDILDNYPIPLLGSVPNFEVAAKKKKGYGYGYGKKG
ncbi:MAG: hypothetical protein IKU52_08720 [Clostridia bacterium]|nr:hypothetical protein [Clostridia bacterium]